MDKGALTEAEVELVELVNALLGQLYYKNRLTFWALRGIHQDTLTQLRLDVNERQPVVVTRERQDMCFDFAAAVEATGGEVPCLTAVSQSPELSNRQAPR